MPDLKTELQRQQELLLDAEKSEREIAEAFFTLLRLYASEINVTLVDEEDDIEDIVAELIDGDRDFASLIDEELEADEEAAFIARLGQLGAAVNLKPLDDYRVRVARSYGRAEPAASHLGFRFIPGWRGGDSELDERLDSEVFDRGGRSYTSKGRDGRMEFTAVTSDYGRVAGRGNLQFLSGGVPATSSSSSRRSSSRRKRTMPVNYALMTAALLEYYGEQALREWHGSQSRELIIGKAYYNPEEQRFELYCLSRHDRLETLGSSDVNILTLPVAVYQRLNRAYPADVPLPEAEWAGCPVQYDPGERASNTFWYARRELQAWQAYHAKAKVLTSSVSDALGMLTYRVNSLTKADSEAARRLAGRIAKVRQLAKQLRETGEPPEPEPPALPANYALRNAVKAQARAMGFRADVLKRWDNLLPQECVFQFFEALEQQGPDAATVTARQGELLEWVKSQSMLEPYEVVFEFQVALYQGYGHLGKDMAKDRKAQYKAVKKACYQNLAADNAAQLFDAVREVSIPKGFSLTGSGIARLQVIRDEFVGKPKPDWSSAACTAAAYAGELAAHEALFDEYKRQHEAWRTSDAKVREVNELGDRIEALCTTVEEQVGSAEVKYHSLMEQLQELDALLSPSTLALAGIDGRSGMRYSLSHLGGELGSAMDEGVTLVGERYVLSMLVNSENEFAGLCKRKGIEPLVCPSEHTLSSLRKLAEEKQRQLSEAFKSGDGSTLSVSRMNQIQTELMQLRLWSSQLEREEFTRLLRAYFRASGDHDALTAFMGVVASSYKTLALAAYGSDYETRYDVIAAEVRAEQRAGCTALLTCVFDVHFAAMAIDSLDKLSFPSLEDIERRFAFEDVQTFIKQYLEEMPTRFDSRLQALAACLLDVLSRADNEALAAYLGEGVDVAETKSAATRQLAQVRSLGCFVAVVSGKEADGADFGVLLTCQTTALALVESHMQAPKAYNPATASQRAFEAWLAVKEDDVELDASKQVLSDAYWNKKASLIAADVRGLLKDGATRSVVSAPSKVVRLALKVQAMDWVRTNQHMPAVKSALAVSFEREVFASVSASNLHQFFKGTPIFLCGVKLPSIAYEQVMADRFLAYLEDRDSHFASLPGEVLARYDGLKLGEAWGVAECDRLVTVMAAKEQALFASLKRQVLEGDDSEGVYSQLPAIKITYLNGQRRHSSRFGNEKRFMSQVLVGGLKFSEVLAAESRSAAVAQAKILIDFSKEKLMDALEKGFDKHRVGADIVSASMVVLMVDGITDENDYLYEEVRAQLNDDEFECDDKAQMEVELLKLEEVYFARGLTAEFDEIAPAEFFKEGLSVINALTDEQHRGELANRSFARAKANADSRAVMAAKVVACFEALPDLVGSQAFNLRAMNNLLSLYREVYLPCEPDAVKAQLAEAGLEVLLEIEPAGLKVLAENGDLSNALKIFKESHAECERISEAIIAAKAGREVEDFEASASVPETLVVSRARYEELVQQADGVVGTEALVSRVLPASDVIDLGGFAKVPVGCCYAARLLVDFVEQSNQLIAEAVRLAEQRAAEEARAEQLADTLAVVEGVVKDLAETDPVNVRVFVEVMDGNEEEKGGKLAWDYVHEHADAASKARLAELLNRKLMRLDKGVNVFDQVRLREMVSQLKGEAVENAEVASVALDRFKVALKEDGLVQMKAQASLVLVHGSREDKVELARCFLDDKVFKDSETYDVKSVDQLYDELCHDTDFSENGFAKCLVSANTPVEPAVVEPAPARSRPASSSVGDVDDAPVVLSSTVVARPSDDEVEGELDHSSGTVVVSPSDDEVEEDHRSVTSSTDRARPRSREAVCRTSSSRFTMHGVPAQGKPPISRAQSALLLMVTGLLDGDPACGYPAAMKLARHSPGLRAMNRATSMRGLDRRQASLVDVHSIRGVRN